MGFEINTARPRHHRFVTGNRRLRVSVDILFSQSTDKEVDTSFTRQCVLVETRIRLLDALFRNQ